jgi:hypothetical protein
MGLSTTQLREGLLLARVHVEVQGLRVRIAGRQKQATVLSYAKPKCSTPRLTHSGRSFSCPPTSQTVKITFLYWTFSTLQNVQKTSW